MSSVRQAANSGATEPNLSRGKAHLSSWDDKPGAIQKQIAQLPHCESPTRQASYGGQQRCVGFLILYTGGEVRKYQTHSSMQMVPMASHCFAEAAAARKTQ